jgi:hypothetical protein
MAWEKRGGAHLYYTLSKRREGRVVRQYVGGGDVGEAAAAADQERRATRAAEREAMRLALRRHAEVDRQVAVFCEAAETAARALLLLGGYQRHDRGAWRRRRG